MLQINESRVQKRRGGVSACKRVQKKYRKAYQKKLQKMEYERLASVIPAFADKNEVDAVDVVEGAIDYIEQLHHQIMLRMMNGMLPKCPEFSMDSEYPE